MAGVENINTGITWRWRRLRREFWRLLGWRDPRPVIWLRWPWPLSKPWERPRLRLATHGGVGDELMATAVLREIRRRNPKCHLTFVSRRPEFFRELLYLDAVEQYTPADKANTLFLSYSADENVAPPPRPLVSLMAESVGLIMPAAEVDRPSIQLSEELSARLAAIPGPQVVVQPLASKWSPNKEWPTDYWVRLIRLLTEKYSVIEVGTESGLAAAGLGPRFHSLVGQTDLSGFAQVISGAAAFVGPVSGGMHLAAAYQVPAVVIVGGYELPTGYQYPKSTMLYSPVPCAPCWLVKPCPFGLKCLWSIQPEAVREAVDRAVAGEARFEVIETRNSHLEPS